MSSQDITKVSSVTLQENVEYVCKDRTSITVYEKIKKLYK